MRILWLCPLVQHSVRLNVWMPAILPLRDGPTGNFVCEWSSTDLVRTAKYAIGTAEVTQAQLDVIVATGTIHVQLESEWALTFSDLTPTKRLALNNFFTTIGEVRPGTNEVVRDFHQRVAQLVDGKTVEVHLDQLAAKLAQTA